MDLQLLVIFMEGNTYGKKIYYSGSFTRWNYGERSDKGFTYYEYDTEN